MLFAILLPGIWDTVHFTSMAIGSCVQYFAFFPWMSIFRDICLFTSRDMGYLEPPYTSIVKIGCGMIVISMNSQRQY